MSEYITQTDFNLDYLDKYKFDPDLIIEMQNLQNKQKLHITLDKYIEYNETEMGDIHNYIYLSDKHNTKSYDALELSIYALYEDKLTDTWLTGSKFKKLINLFPFSSDTFVIPTHVYYEYDAVILNYFRYVYCIISLKNFLKYDDKKTCIFDFAGANHQKIILFEKNDDKIRIIYINTGEGVDEISHDNYMGLFEIYKSIEINNNEYEIIKFINYISVFIMFNLNLNIIDIVNHNNILERHKLNDEDNIEITKFFDDFVDILLHHNDNEFYKKISVLFNDIFPKYTIDYSKISLFLEKCNEYKLSHSDDVILSYEQNYCKKMLDIFQWKKHNNKIYFELQKQGTCVYRSLLFAWLYTNNDIAQIINVGNNLYIQLLIIVLHQPMFSINYFKLIDLLNIHKIYEENNKNNIIDYFLEKLSSALTYYKTYLPKNIDVLFNPVKFNSDEIQTDIIIRKNIVGTYIYHGDKYTRSLNNSTETTSSFVSDDEINTILNKIRNKSISPLAIIDTYPIYKYKILNYTVIYELIILLLLWEIYNNYKHINKYFHDRSPTHVIYCGRLNISKYEEQMLTNIVNSFILKNKHEIYYSSCLKKLKDKYTDIFLTDDKTIEIIITFLEKHGILQYNICLLSTLHIELQGQQSFSHIIQCKQLIIEHILKNSIYISTFINIQIVEFVATHKTHFRGQVKYIVFQYFLYIMDNMSEEYLILIFATFFNLLLDNYIIVFDGIPDELFIYINDDNNDKISKKIVKKHINVVKKQFIDLCIEHKNEYQKIIDNINDFNYQLEIQNIKSHPMVTIDEDTDNILINGSPVHVYSGLLNEYVNIFFNIGEIYYYDEKNCVFYIALFSGTNIDIIAFYCELVDVNKFKIVGIKFNNKIILQLLDDKLYPDNILNPIKVHMRDGCYNFCQLSDDGTFSHLIYIYNLKDNNDFFTNMFYQKNNNDFMVLKLLINDNLITYNLTLDIQMSLEILNNTCPYIYPNMYNILSFKKYKEYKNTNINTTLDTEFSLEHNELFEEIIQYQTSIKLKFSVLKLNMLSYKEINKDMFIIPSNDKLADFIEENPVCEIKTANAKIINISIIQYNEYINEIIYIIQTICSKINYRKIKENSIENSFIDFIYDNYKFFLYILELNILKKNLINIVKIFEKNKDSITKLNCNEITDLYKLLELQQSNSNTYLNGIIEILLGLIISKKQLNKYDDFMKNYTEKKKWKVHHFMMGKGKSSVLTPLIALQFFNKNVNVVVPTHLINQTHQQFIQFKIFMKKSIEIYDDVTLKKLYIKNMNFSVDTVNIFDEFDYMFNPLQSNLNMVKTNKQQLTSEIIQNLIQFVHDILEKKSDVVKDKYYLIEADEIMKNMYYVENVTYGIHKKKRICIPYLRKDTPLNDSTFKSVIITCVLTILHFIKNKYKLHADDLIYIYTNKNNYKCNELLKLIYSYYDIDDTYFKLSYDIFNQKIENFIDDPIHHDKKYNIFNKYMHIILLIKESIEIENASFFDIMNMDCLWQVGYSGTVDIKIPEYKHIKYDHIIEHDFDEYYGTYFAFTGTYPTSTNDIINAENEDNIFIKFKEKKYDVLIDACAYLKYYTNEKIAEILSNENTRRVIYLTSDDIKMMYFNSNHVLFDDVLYDDAIYYYDQKHIVGIDFKQPGILNGLVLVDDQNNYPQIAQSIFRMRKLNRGHIVNIGYCGKNIEILGLIQTNKQLAKEKIYEYLKKNIENKNTSVQNLSLYMNLKHFCRKYIGNGNNIETNIYIYPYVSNTIDSIINVRTLEKTFINSPTVPFDDFANVFKNIINNNIFKSTILFSNPDSNGRLRILKKLLILKYEDYQNDFDNMLYNFFSIPFDELIYLLFGIYFNTSPILTICEVNVENNIDVDIVISTDVEIQIDMYSDLEIYKFKNITKLYTNFCFSREISDVSIFSYSIYNNIIHFSKNIATGNILFCPELCLIKMYSERHRIYSGKKTTYTYMIEILSNSYLYYNIFPIYLLNGKLFNENIGGVDKYIDTEKIFDINISINNKMKYITSFYLGNIIDIEQTIKTQHIRYRDEFKFNYTFLTYINQFIQLKKHKKSINQNKLDERFIDELAINDKIINCSFIRTAEYKKTISNYYKYCIHNKDKILNHIDNFRHYVLINFPRYISINISDNELFAGGNNTNYKYKYYKYKQKINKNINIHEIDLSIKSKKESDYYYYKYNKYKYKYLHSKLLTN
jgi:hypothetical protein